MPLTPAAAAPRDSAAPAVVVTGAAGFLGGHLVDRLLRQQTSVLGVDRQPVPDHLAGRPGLTWARTELTDPLGREPVDEALRAAEAVWHLAGCPGVRDRAADVDRRRHRDNVQATAAVLAGTPLHTPLLLSSSSSVYGGSRSGRPCAESDLLDPQGGYAASKVRAERLCGDRAAAGGHVLVVRPFTVAGERQRPDMALSQWIDAARRERPLQLLGSPDRTRDVTDVRQVARALVDLARCGATGTVNLGTGRAHTLAALADAVCRAVGRDVPRVVRPAGSVEVRHTLADTARLERLVGWTPRTDLAELVVRQAAAQPDAVLGVGTAAATG